MTVHRFPRRHVRPIPVSEFERIYAEIDARIRASDGIDHAEVRGDYASRLGDKLVNITMVIAAVLLGVGLAAWVGMPS